MSNVHMRRPPAPAHALIEDALLGAVALGGIAMLTFPAARGVDETFGWLPLWLSVLPLGAWAMARTEVWAKPFSEKSCSAACSRRARVSSPSLRAVRWEAGMMEGAPELMAPD